MKNNFFIENVITSEGASSHNVLYYQPLPITRYQLRFYANKYFEYSVPLPLSIIFMERVSNVLFKWAISANQVIYLVITKATPLIKMKFNVSEKKKLREENA